MSSTFICTRRTFVSDKRGNTTQYNPGQVIKADKYIKMNSIQKSAFSPKPRADRYSYSVDEFVSMAQIYIKLSNRSITDLDAYWQEWVNAQPNSSASREGVICYFCIIRGLDSQSDYQGFSHPAIALQVILDDMQPDRFSQLKVA